VFRDVPGDPVDAADFAPSLFGDLLHGDGPELHNAEALPGGRPGPAAQPHLDAVRQGPSRDRGLEEGPDLVGVLFVDDGGKGLSPQRGALVAQETLYGVVDEQKFPLRPEGEDDVGRVMDEAAVPLLAGGKPAPEGVAFGPQPHLVEGVFHAPDELIVLEGFPEIVVGPALQGLHGRLDGGVPRHHDDRHVGIPVPDEVQQVEAVHLRHHEIEQHQVAPVVLQPRHGVPRGGARLDAVVPLPEKYPHALAHPDFVVDNQDSWGSRHGLLRFMLFSRTR